MRRTIWVLLLIGGLLAGVALVSGVRPMAIAQVAGGMGAKLACSGRFVSGLSPEQILDDLRSYSPAYGLVSLRYGSDSVRASLFGLGAHSARYRPGLGCTLEVGDTSALDAVRLNPVDARPLPRTGALDEALQGNSGAGQRR